ncbi:MAG: hypothetical protein ACR2NW_07890 [Thermodesulfobacteriota bacterium]
MPKLIIPKETFDFDERKLIPKIQMKYRDLIEQHIENTEVYVFGKFDGMFWEEVVLSKPREIIFDPIYENPVDSIVSLTHFGAITFEDLPGKEYYYGNKDLKLEEFIKLLLSKAVTKEIPVRDT